MSKIAVLTEDERKQLEEYRAASRRLREALDKLVNSDDMRLIIAHAEQERGVEVFTKVGLVYGLRQDAELTELLSYEAYGWGIIGYDKENQTTLYK
jgi:hypothetical protein